MLHRVATAVLFMKTSSPRGLPEVVKSLRGGAQVWGQIDQRWAVGADQVLGGGAATVAIATVTGSKVVGRVSSCRARETEFKVLRRSAQVQVFSAAW